MFFHIYVGLPKVAKWDFVGVYPIDIVISWWKPSGNFTSTNGVYWIKWLHVTRHIYEIYPCKTQVFSKVSQMCPDWLSRWETMCLTLWSPLKTLRLIGAEFCGYIIYIWLGIYNYLYTYLIEFCGWSWWSSTLGISQVAVAMGGHLWFRDACEAFWRRKWVVYGAGAPFKPWACCC